MPGVHVPEGTVGVLETTGAELVGVATVVVALVVDDDLSVVDGLAVVAGDVGEAAPSPVMLSMTF